MRYLVIVLAAVALTGCEALVGCRIPGTTGSSYVGAFSRSSASVPSSLVESDSNAITVGLDESDGTGTLDGVTMTVARRGLRDFGDVLSIRDRRTGEALASSDYGYYRGSDSLVFRTHTYRESGAGNWNDFKAAADAGHAYFQLQAQSARDTAGIRLVRRNHVDGACT